MIKEGRVGKGEEGAEEKRREIRQAEVESQTDNNRKCEVTLKSHS